MNLDDVKSNIKNNLGKSITIKIYGLRNRTETIKGILKNAYPNIFTVLIDNQERSFKYSDIITKEIIIKYM